MNNEVIEFFVVEGYEMICVWCRQAPATLYHDDDGAIQSICAKCVNAGRVWLPVTSGVETKIRDGYMSVNKDSFSGDLLAYGRQEALEAMQVKDRDRYQFWQGWNAALERVEINKSERRRVMNHADTPYRPPLSEWK